MTNLTKVSANATTSQIRPEKGIFNLDADFDGKYPDCEIFSGILIIFGFVVSVLVPLTLELFIAT